MENLIGHGLGENHAFGFREQILLYIEYIIDLQMAKVCDVKVKILIQSGFQTVCFDLKTRFLFYKDTGVTHISDII